MRRGSDTFQAIVRWWWRIHVEGEDFLLGTPIDNCATSQERDVDLAGRHSIVFGVTASWAAITRGVVVEVVVEE